MPQPEDYNELLSALQRRNLPLICANPDLVVHIGSDLSYCAGILAEAYAKLGGEVIQAGKPYSPIYEKAFAALGGPCDRAKILVIGDAMHTDIKGGHLQGLASLFVSDGIHSAALHGGGQGQLNETNFAQLLETYGVAPTAVIKALAW
jgi:HAD superfamily hydrolase (TIGR01459 family)